MTGRPPYFLSILELGKRLTSADSTLMLVRLMADKFSRNYKNPENGPIAVKDKEKPKCNAINH